MYIINICGKLILRFWGISEIKLLANICVNLVSVFEVKLPFFPNKATMRMQFSCCIINFLFFPKISLKIRLITYMQSCNSCVDLKIVLFLETEVISRQATGQLTLRMASRTMCTHHWHGTRTVSCIIAAMTFRLSLSQIVEFLEHHFQHAMTIIDIGNPQHCNRKVTTVRIIATAPALFSSCWHYRLAQNTSVF